MELGTWADAVHQSDERRLTAPRPFHPPMSTRPSQSAADILADGRNVLVAAKTYAKQFKAFDAGRKKKILDPAIVARLAAN
jgi:hypothetical protein